VVESNLIRLKYLDPLLNIAKKVEFLQVHRRENIPKLQIFQIQEIIINKEEKAGANQVLLMKIKVSHRKQLIIIRWPT